MTAARLGEIASVSESTVVRFAAALGYDGYPSLQKHLQETVKSHLTSVQRMEVAAGRFSGADVIDKALSADAEMIKATRETISREAFAGSVEAINRARKIYILGVRSAASLASFAAYYMKLVYDNIELIDTSSSAGLFEQLYRIDSGDVCIAVSFPRYSSQTLSALRFASGRGATIISVTDGEDSPIAKYATYLLAAKSNMLSFVDSLVAPLSVINALIAACAAQRGEQVYANLRTLEEIWDEYGVYQKNDGEDTN